MATGKGGGGGGGGSDPLDPDSWTDNWGSDPTEWTDGIDAGDIWSDATKGMGVDNMVYQKIPAGKEKYLCIASIPASSIIVDVYTKNHILEQESMTFTTSSLCFGRNNIDIRYTGEQCLLEGVYSGLLGVTEGGYTHYELRSTPCYLHLERGPSIYRPLANNSTGENISDICFKYKTLGIYCMYSLNDETLNNLTFFNTKGAGDDCSLAAQEYTGMFGPYTALNGEIPADNSNRQYVYIMTNRDMYNYLNSAEPYNEEWFNNEWGFTWSRNGGLINQELVGKRLDFYVRNCPTGERDRLVISHLLTQNDVDLGYFTEGDKYPYMVNTYSVYRRIAVRNIYNQMLLCNMNNYFTFPYECSFEVVIS